MNARILICDDDPAVRGTLTRLLTHAGYTITAVGTGAQALAEVSREHPDLILLDVGLPDMSGFEICQRLRRAPDGDRLRIAMITGLTDAEARIAGLECGADDFLNKPFEFPVLLARVRALLRIRQLTDMLESTENVIVALARTVEARDAYTDAHLWRIAEYSCAVMRALGASEQDVKDTWYGGLLHDIGKIGVSDAVLHKPGRLTPEESAQMEQHPDIGAGIVATMRFASRVGPLVRFHHERWDGHGYPLGLSGEQIPLGARVIAVADSWDAMTTDRPYRKALEPEVAVKRLQEGAGSQWDAQVVDMFVRLLRSGGLQSALESRWTEMGTGARIALHVA